MVGASASATNYQLKTNVLSFNVATLYTAELGIFAEKNISLPREFSRAAILFLFRLRLDGEISVLKEAIVFGTFREKSEWNGYT